MIGYNSYTINKSGYMVQYPNTETITAPSVIKQNTTITHTGATAETKIFSQLIPAGTFQANDWLYFFMQCGATSNGNNKAFRVYINNTDDLTTPLQLGILNLTSSNLMAAFDRQIIFKNSISNQEMVSNSTSISNYLTGGNFSPTALTIDFTANQYFVVSCQLAVGTDTAYIYGIKSLLSRWWAKIN